MSDEDCLYNTSYINIERYISTSVHLFLWHCVSVIIISAEGANYDCQTCDHCVSGKVNLSNK